MRKAVSDEPTIWIKNHQGYYIGLLTKEARGDHPEFAFVILGHKNDCRRDGIIAEKVTILNTPRLENMGPMFDLPSNDRKAFLYGLMRRIFIDEIHKEITLVDDVITGNFSLEITIKNGIYSRKNRFLSILSVETPEKVVINYKQSNANLSNPYVLSFRSVSNTYCCPKISEDWRYLSNNTTNLLIPVEGGPDVQLIKSSNPFDFRVKSQENSVQAQKIRVTGVSTSLIEISKNSSKTLGNTPLEAIIAVAHKEKTKDAFRWNAEDSTLTVWLPSHKKSYFSMRKAENLGLSVFDRFDADDLEAHVDNLKDLEKLIDLSPENKAALERIITGISQYEETNVDTRFFLAKSITLFPQEKGYGLSSPWWPLVFASAHTTTNYQGYHIQLGIDKGQFCFRIGDPNTQTDL